MTVQIREFFDQDMGINGSPRIFYHLNITYIRINEGWLYLEAVLDLHSHPVVGWCMSSLMQTSLVLDALTMLGG